MWRLNRWSRSWTALFVFNAVLVWFAFCVGWYSASLRGEQLQVQPHPANERVRPHAAHILQGNLRVVAMLLVGVCTLGLFTLLELVSNAFVLGYGLSAVASGMPEAIPLVARYVPLEFSAFILAASVAEHLSFGLLRCLAVGEPMRLKPALVGLATVVTMLGIAAIVEADVTGVVALLAN